MIIINIIAVTYITSKFQQVHNYDKESNKLMAAKLKAGTQIYIQNYIYIHIFTNTSVTTYPCTNIKLRRHK